MYGEGFVRDRVMRIVDSCVMKKFTEGRVSHNGLNAFQCSGLCSIIVWILEPA